MFPLIPRWSAVGTARTLLRTHTAYEVPVVPVVVIAVELTTIVVQVVTIRGIVCRSRPPVPVAGIVEGTIVVVAARDSFKLPA